MSVSGRSLVHGLASGLVWVIGVACFGVLALIGIGPRSGMYSTLTVLSGSMHPAIPVGAMIIDTPESPNALRVGQIVTYAVPVDDHHVVSHRVTRIISAGDHPVFETKGDANDSVDPWQVRVAGSAVWQVRAVVPQIGGAIHWLRGRSIHILGVLVLPALLLAWWVVNIWRDGDDEGEATVLA